MFLQSLNESYEIDVYDEILSQVEIQGHVTAVNGNNAYYINQIVCFLHLYKK